MKFVSIPTTIEAEQVLDSDTVIQQIVNWVGPNADIIRDEEGALKGIRINEEGGGFYSALPGDWIVQFSDGQFAVAVADEFWNNWEFPKEVKPEPPVDTEQPRMPEEIPETESMKRERRKWAIEKVLENYTVTTLDAAVVEAKKLATYLKNGDKDEDLHDQEALDQAYLVIAESVAVVVPPESEGDPAVVEAAKVDAAEKVIDDLTKGGVRFKNGTVIAE